MRSRESLVVDMDEVLIDYKTGCAAYFADQHGHEIPVLTMAQYFTDEYLGAVDAAEAEQRMRGVFLSGYAAHMLPKREALDGIHELAEDVDLFVGTARGEEDRPVTEAMLDTYYPGIFKDVMLGNHFSDAGPRLDKRDMCAKIGAIGLVDDNHHALKVAEVGRLGFLFGDYSWNRSVRAHQNLIPVSSMREVHGFLRRIGVAGHAAR